MTPRDHFAFWLLLADVALAALTTIVALSSLSRENGVLAKPWLWIVYGQLVCAMGDAVQPLLQLEDTVLYTALLWSFGYALIAAGSSLLVDVLEWQANRPQGSPRPLLRPRPPVAQTHSWFRQNAD